MSWLVAILVAAVGLILIRRERKIAEAEVQRVAEWISAILKTNKLPPTGPLKTAVIAKTASDLEQLASEIESARRDQSAETASLQTILTSMAEGVMVVDSRHVIRRVNPSFLRIIGLNFDPLGQYVLRALRDVHFDDVITAALKSGEPQSSEVSLPGKPARHLSLTATLIRESSGENAVLLICHDITRLRQLEDVRRQFVANVSHELRTPLAIFQGYVENLLDNPDIAREELVSSLEILKRHSTRLNALVEDLLVLARLESRTQPLQPEQVDPRKLIDTIAADWQIRAKERGVTLVSECAAETPEFEADPFRIEQVLHNLMDNAMKHTQAGGRITLRAAPSATGVEFRVTDTGVGISAQDLPHVFERFYRGDKARKREQGGTGLGLSIVKHIVQLHGGSVSAESTLGAGTCIILQLPLIAPAAAQTEPRADVASEVRQEQQSDQRRAGPLRV